MQSTSHRVGTGAASPWELLCPCCSDPEVFSICPAARLWAAREHNAGLLLLHAFRVCSAAVELDC